MSQHQFPNITLYTGKARRRGTLEIDDKSELSFQVAGKSAIKIPSDDIRSGTFIQSFDGYQWRIHLKNQSTMKLRLFGFKADAFTALEAFMKAHGKEMKKEIVSTKGANAGEFNFTENALVFQIEQKLAFEIPINSIVRTNVPNANEVAVEFKEESTATEGSLFEMRIYVPDEIEEEKEGKEGEEGEEEESLTGAEKFASLFPQTDQGVRGDVLVSFEVSCDFPRGKFTIDLMNDSLKFSKQGFQIRIEYKSISRMFLFDNSTLDRQHLLVINLQSPFRQGRTSYSFIVIRFPAEESIVKTINLDENQIKERYGEGVLNKEMKGPIQDVASRVFKAITGAKVLVPGSFRSSRVVPCVRCSYKANSGFLFICEKSFVFVKKPPIYLPHSLITHIEFDRVVNSGEVTSFDIKIFESSGVEYVFSSIGREEYSRLLAFIRGKNLNIINDNELPEFISAGTGGRKDIDYNEDAAYKRRLEAEIGDDGDDDDEEDDEDYEAKSSGSEDSEASGGEGSEGEGMAEEVSEDDGGEGGGGAKEKKVRKKKESKESGGGKKEKGAGKKKKKKGGPKRAKNAYMWFMESEQGKIRQEHPEWKVGEVGRECGVRWKALTAEQKAPFEKKAEDDKKRYHAEMDKMEIEGGGGDDDDGSGDDEPKKKKSKSKKDSKPKKQKKINGIKLFAQDFRQKQPPEFKSLSTDAQKDRIREAYKKLSESEIASYKKKAKQLNKENGVGGSKGEKDGKKRKRSQKTKEGGDDGGGDGEGDGDSKMDTESVNGKDDDEGKMDQD